MIRTHGSVRWHDAKLSGLRDIYSDRVSDEMRILADRRRAEKLARDCAIPAGPLTGAFAVGGQIIAPCAISHDANGQFIMVSVDGRLCCQGEERDGTSTRTVLMLVDSAEHDDAPTCQAAVDWCEFEYRVRTQDKLAIAIYGLMLAALVIRQVEDKRRAEKAIDRADDAFADVMRAMETT